MKIGIIGFGLEGQAAYEYWQGKGEITVCDIKEVDVPHGVLLQSGSGYLADISRFDVIVRSPAVKPSDLVAVAGEDIMGKVTSNTNEFFKACPSKNVIGITGTKGKGTTSTLVAKILEASGKRVHLGGNIGLPALSLIKQAIAPDDWVILELSSFQLVDCHYSPHIGICLMVVPEHLDWHPEINDYFNAKTQLFRHQTADDVAIYFAENENSKRIASTGKGWKIPYCDEPGALVKDNYISIADHNICSIDELGLIGPHNRQNVCAAITAIWQITRELEPIRQVLLDFKGLEHRLEFVKETDGVSYYDDSFATTPESSIVAIESFDSPKIIVLGGSDKGASYTELAVAVKEGNVRAAVVIGEQGEKIKEALKSAGFNNIYDGGHNMSEIIATAHGLSKPGDTVLLSPACASFDMFANYKDRGDKFKQAVRALASAA